MQTPDEMSSFFAMSTSLKLFISTFKNVENQKVQVFF